jgi:transposase
VRRSCRATPRNTPCVAGTLHRTSALAGAGREFACVEFCLHALDRRVDVFAAVRYLHPRLRHLFVDGAYGGTKVDTALDKIGKWTIEIVKRSDAVRGFVVLLRRRVVERTRAWLNRNRRLTKEFESSLQSTLTWLFLASVKPLIDVSAGYNHCRL